MSKRTDKEIDKIRAERDQAIAELKQAHANLEEAMTVLRKMAAMVIANVHDERAYALIVKLAFLSGGKK